MSNWPKKISRFFRYYILRTAVDEYATRTKGVAVSLVVVRAPLNPATEAAGGSRGFEALVIAFPSNCGSTGALLIAGDPLRREAQLFHELAQQLPG